tara:strand:+ start:908 stop:1084 length:177 start_codon:yes stop_codon:yes gene_type:complete
VNRDNAKSEPWLEAKSLDPQNFESMFAAAFDVRLKCLANGAYSANFWRYAMNYLFQGD